MMKQVPFVKKKEAANSIVIPDWHKKEIDQSMEAYLSAPENFHDWEEIKRKTDHKYGL